MITAVTTFHKEGLDLYGQRFLDSFANNVDKQVKLVVYAEDCEPINPDPTQITIVPQTQLSKLMAFKNKWKDVPKVMTKAAMVSSVVLLLVGAAMAFKTVVSLSHAPEHLAAFVLGLTDNPYVLLFLINILLFVVGMFLDAGPAIIILGPILGPVFVELGVHPVHFAILMSVNLTVGLATPPMGLVLFVASSVSGERVETIAKARLPFLAVEAIVIFLITYFPSISMTIPLLTGFAK